MIFDIRTTEEFATGHLLGAINIPANHLGSSELCGAKPDQEITLYCPDEKVASVALSILKGRGFENIHISEAIAPSNIPIVPEAPLELHAYKH